MTAIERITILIIIGVMVMMARVTRMTRVSSRLVYFTFSLSYLLIYALPKIECTKSSFDLAIDSNIFRWLRNLTDPSPGSIHDLLAGPRRFLRLKLTSAEHDLNIVPEDGRCGYNLAAVFYYLSSHPENTLSTVNFKKLTKQHGSSYLLSTI